MNGQSPQSPVQEQPVGDGQVMQVKVISPSAEREEKPARRSAVFVAHGMGQQRRFDTLDQIAVGLIKADSAARWEAKDTAIPTPEVITIERSDGYLHGVKLRLRAESAECETHIFEGYWAPLAEGAVNLRDVIAFLFSAGFNGLAKAGRQLIRILFNREHAFPADFPATVYLLTAMLALAALVIMNTAIVTVAALGSPLTNSPVWLKGLRPDLTTLFNLLLLIAAAFSLTIYLSARSRRGPQGAQNEKGRGLINSSIALFIGVIVTMIAGGLAIPLLFYGHVYGQPETEYLKKAFGAGLVAFVNCGFGLILLSLAVALLAVAARKVAAMIAHTQRKMARSSKLLFWGAVAMLAIILALEVRLGSVILPDPGGGWSASAAFGSIGENPWTAIKSVCYSLSGLSWPLLIAVSWYVRGLLVQYVGDVALYVDSHKLDRFDSLRENIRKTVQTAAKAVYEAPAANGFAYDSVFIVGHSLGSVVVYDALNRLINEDELGGGKLRIVERTKLLLTFGSPLDKIAFLFARQYEGTGPFIREALVAAAQPLVQSAGFRQFEWINIWSKLDIISGRLDFFDLPPGGTGTGGGESLKPKPVRNLIDDEARTLLAAHVEYWGNSLLYRTLREQITKNA
jgi:hypothetical protein